jgi:uncharacterized protein (TIGR00251 family)
VVIAVMPNAKKTEVAGVHGDALKVRLHAPPVDGKANEALIRYLAARLILPKSAITLLHGQTARRKLLAIDHPGCTVASVAGLLHPAAPDH